MTRKTITGLTFALIASAAMGAQRIEDAYIAPVNHYIFKLVLPDGTMREFQRDPSRYGGIMGADGWDGDISDDGKIIVRGRENGALNRIFTFDRGRLVSHQTEKEKVDFPYEAVRKAPKTRFSPLEIVTYEDAEKQAEDYSKNEMAVKWSGTGRLSFPYNNPNFSGALYAQLALLALGLMFMRRKAAKISGAVLFSAFVACMIMTGSRGAFLGFACGMAAVVAFRFRTLVSSRLFWGAAAICALALGLWLATGGYANLTRGFTAGGGLDWSNQIRMDMMRAAPFMMVDAPGGWEFCHVGRAYLDWYQPVEMLCLTGSLMNDHLSVLVKCGWWMRFGYLVLLFAVIGGAVAYAAEKRNPVPLAVAVAFPLMACLNPVFTEWGLWAVPAVALLPVLKVFRRRNTAIVVTAASAFLSLAVLAAFYFAGSAAERREDCPPLFIDGSRIRINGRNPRTWVVDDGRGALGGLLVGKDIRSFYSSLSRAPSMGYVTDIADLPSKGVDRLVLAGKAGTDWLVKLSEDEKARNNLPKSVVFVSPPFLPSEIPEGVRMCCNPTILVGEFAALYQDEYLKPEKTVTVVPGMEKYILMWPQYVIGE